MAEEYEVETGEPSPQPETDTPEEVLDAEVQEDKDLKRWRHRAACDRKLRKDWESEFKVKECEEFYLGKQWQGLKPGEKVINHFLSTIRVTIPGLIFDQPKFLARPKPGAGTAATQYECKVAEGVLNSVATQDSNLRNASRLGLLQNFFRVGVLKIVYDPSLEPNPRAGQPILKQDASGNILYAPAEMGMDSLTGMPIQGEPQPQIETDPLTGQELLEPDMVLSDETYRFEWVDARCMLFPDYGPDMTKWPRIGEEIEVDLEDAKQDERFPAELRKLFKPAGKSDYDSKGEDYEGDDKDYDQCFRYCEYYDLKHKEHLIFTEQDDIKQFLLREPLPDGIEDHPYAILQGWILNTGPEPSPWPLPYTSPWVELQSEYNISRQQQIEGGKRSARKVLFEANTFPPSEGGQEEALKALQSSKDMEGVMVTDINRPPRAMEEVDLNPAIYKSSASIMMDWRIVTATPSTKVGIADADTATEAQLVSQASNIQEADMQKDVTEWLRVAGAKMLQLIKQTLTLKLWVNIRGMSDQAVQMYMQATYGIPPMALAMFPNLADSVVQRYGDNRVEGITREQLTSQVDIDIAAGSMKPRNITSERTQLLEFLSLIAKAPQVALSRRLLETIAEKYEMVDSATVEEVHALAMTMIQINQNQAGREQGGANQETGKGSAEAKKNGRSSQMSQGNGVNEE